MGAGRSRTPAKLQFEPRIDILQHGYDICAAKYGKLARQVPSETLFLPQNKTSSPALGVGEFRGGDFARGHVHVHCHKAQHECATTPWHTKRPITAAKSFIILAYFLSGNAGKIVGV